MLAGLSSVYEPGRRYSCRNGSRLVFRKQPGCCGSVEDHSSYIWVWKSEAVVYSLILLVTLGRSWTISNTTAILAALSSRSGHLQAWVGVMCPSWPRGMHSVSRVVHFEQLAHFRDERQLSASDSRNLVHRRHDSVCCSLHASAMDVPLVGPVYGVDAILGLGWRLVVACASTV